MFESQKINYYLVENKVGKFLKKSFILIPSVLGGGNGNSIKVYTGGLRGSQLPAVASCMTVYLPAETTHAASFTGR